MTRKEFIAEVAEKASVGTTVARNVSDAVFEVLAELMVDDDKVSIPGFGTFASVQRAPRNARNPHTGESIKVPAKTAPKFKPAPTLRRMVEGLE